MRPDAVTRRRSSPTPDTVHARPRRPPHRDGPDIPLRPVARPRLPATSAPTTRRHRKDGHLRDRHRTAPLAGCARTHLPHPDPACTSRRALGRPPLLRRPVTHRRRNRSHCHRRAHGTTAVAIPHGETPRGLEPGDAAVRRDGHARLRHRHRHRPADDSAACDARAGWAARF
ncbi:hypothetical protein GCM10009624_27460 [Gordonia sinesedis]